jgi:hypothetical protein
MKKKNLILLVTVLFALSLQFSLPVRAENWQSVEKIFNRKGTENENMIKITFPRSDLKVMVGNVILNPGLALTSWAAFKPMPKETMVMGDLVLTDKEVSPVMFNLSKAGFLITGLHNHILNETPAVMYMHFDGHGDAVKLANNLKSALKLTGTPLGTPKPAVTKKGNWGAVEKIIGVTGQNKGEIISFSIPRKEKVMADGDFVQPFLGVATAINIQFVGGKAAATGDFVLLANEVNPVIKALTEHGIAVTALHNHMMNENPRLFFMHFWGYDAPEKLAKGLKAAINKIH